MPEAAPPDRSWRARMLADVDGGRIGEATDALLALTLDDPDGDWVEGVLMAHVDDPVDIQIRSLAITCFGHLARIHGRINRSVVIPKLKSLLHDPILSGIAEDALGDIGRYADED